MSELIGKLGSDHTKSLQVNIEEFKGITGVDIREWYMDNKDVFHPTTKGIRIPLNQVSALVTLLEQAEVNLHKQGILK